MKNTNQFSMYKTSVALIGSIFLVCTLTSCSKASEVAVDDKALLTLCQDTSNYITEVGGLVPSSDFESSWKFGLQLLKQSAEVHTEFKSALVAALRIQVDSTGNPDGHLDANTDSQIREFVKTFCGS